MKRRFVPRLFSGLLCATALCQAQAQIEADPPQSSLRISGFGSVGVSHVDAPAGWGFRRELNQTGSDASLRADVDTRLGVQLNYSINPQFEAVAQALFKKRGPHAIASDSLEWAYLIYRPAAEWTVRLGRVNVDAFLMAGYRNVGYGFAPARPQAEVYGMLPTTLDGADIARSWRSGDAQWRVKLMTGGGRIGDLTNGPANTLHSLVGVMASREQDGLLLRASYFRGRIRTGDDRLAPVLAGLDQLAALPLPSVASEAAALHRRLDINGVWGSYSEIGARQELADWLWSAEAVYVSAKPVTSQTSVALLLGRHVGDWTPYAGFGWTRTLGEPLATPSWAAPLTPVLGPVGAAQVQALGAGAAQAFNGNRFNQSSWSIGTRWDFRPQMALKLQWEQIRISPNGSALWTRGTADAGHARVASVILDFMF